MTTALSRKPWPHDEAVVGEKHYGAAFSFIDGPSLGLWKEKIGKTGELWLEARRVLTPTGIFFVIYTINFLKIVRLPNWRNGSAFDL